jgi:hypothetical protein
MKNENFDSDNNLNLDSLIYTDEESKCRIYVGKVYTKIGSFETSNISYTEIKVKSHPARNYHDLLCYASGFCLLFGIFQILYRDNFSSVIWYFLASLILFILSFPLKNINSLYELSICVIDYSKDELEKPVYLRRGQLFKIAICLSKAQVERLDEELKRAKNIARKLNSELSMKT